MAISLYSVRPSSDFLFYSGEGGGGVETKPSTSIFYVCPFLNSCVLIDINCTALVRDWVRSNERRPAPKITGEPTRHRLESVRLRDDRK